MDVECKWFGSVYDVKVFVNFFINVKLRDNKLLIIYQLLVLSGVKVFSYFIGDLVYLLFLFCMKEYDICVRDE